MEKKNLIFINFDEVPIFFDYSQNKTYDMKGTKSIELKSNKGTKLRTTVLLGICSDGSKLPPLIILKNRNVKKPINPFPLQTLVFQNKAGWMDHEILECFLKTVVLNLNFASSMYTPYLILDKCPAHTHKSMKELLSESKLHYKFIPSGCTGLAQPIDAHVGKPFKDRVKNLHKKWFEEIGSLKSNTTKQENFKDPVF